MKKSTNAEYLGYYQHMTAAAAVVARVTQLRHVTRLVVWFCGTWEHPVRWRRSAVVLVLPTWLLLIHRVRYWSLAFWSEIFGITSQFLVSTSAIFALKRAAGFLFGKWCYRNSCDSVVKWTVSRQSDPVSLLSSGQINHDNLCSQIQSQHFAVLGHVCWLTEDAPAHTAFSLAVNTISGRHLSQWIRPRGLCANPACDVATDHIRWRLPQPVAGHAG